MVSFMAGREIVKLALKYGWIDKGGTKHPYQLEKAGKRPVPVRGRLENPNEIRKILGQLDIPRADWPEKLK